jgi:general secretion pathway protein A
MNHQHFGLSEAPFSIEVNPRYLFMSQRHRDALAHLLYGVGGGGGFILLTGEVGTGKTTINRCLLEQLPATTDLAIILNPALSAVELLATACDELQISYPDGTESLKALTDALNHYLLDNHGAGRRTVLMIDEAQHLDFDVLEQIRLLTNLETNDEKLLQIILIGQPELTEKLARPELRQLNQRITARYNLQPLDRGETAAYIRHRLDIAGLKGGQTLFSDAAVKEVHHITRGIPRLINVLCDRSLLGAYGKKMAQVSPKLVKEAASEVFGQESRSNASSYWLPALAAVIVAIVLGALVLQGPKTAGPESAVVDSNQLEQGGSTIPQNEMPVEKARTSIDVPVLELDAVVPSDRVQAASSAPVVTSPPASAITPNWLFSPSDGEALLWRVASDLNQPASVCPALTGSAIQCTITRSDVFDDIVGLGRPVLLDMVSPDRFSATTLLMGFDGTEALVWSDLGLVRVTAGELALAWSGGYRYLWRAPEEWDGALSIGSSGAPVTTVANMFATLDGRELRPQAVFSELLAERVRLFQKSEGLVADGVVGEKTLLRLMDRLGEGLDQNRGITRVQAWEVDR